MTLEPARSPVRTPRARVLLRALAALTLVLVPLASAQAGADDFEFGQRLAQRGYFDLARRVYERMLSDGSRTPEEKDAAKYGIALLTRHQAETAVGTTAPYGEIKDLFEKAVQEAKTFVANNPKHPKADEARLAIGSIRLSFVRFCEQMLGDAEDAREHGAQLDVVREDAKKAVDDAIAYFDGLKESGGGVADLARLNWVISQYYRALVLVPCSPEAVTALKNAAVKLDDYVTDNDGYLVAAFAQDFVGLVYWKLADCEQDAKEQEKLFGTALSWFDTCIETPNDGDDYLKVITSGYYHAGQVCLEAGKTFRRFWREGSKRISGMQEKHPTAWRTDTGLRALVEWSKIECAAGNSQKAIEIANDVAERAKQVAMPWMERLAGRQLNLYVSGSCGTAGEGAGSLEPEVLQRVADDLYLQKKYPEAIRAYRSVVQAIGDSPKAFVSQGMPAWRKISDAYAKLGDLLGAALALEPIHEAWMDGRIPHKAGDPQDPLLKQAGDDRQRAIRLLGDLHKETQSTVFKARADAMRNAFAVEYPQHPETTRTSQKTGLDLFSQADELRRAKDPKAAAKYEEARRAFELVLGERDAAARDIASAYIVLIHLRMGKHEDALKSAAKAEEYWESAAAKADAEKFPDVRAKREVMRARVRVAKAEALEELARWPDIVAATEGFSTSVGANEVIPQRLLALRVRALLETGKVAEADADWRRLLALDSKWPGLANVAHRFAAQYTTQYREIEKELRELDAKLRGKEGLNRRLLDAERARDSGANAIADRTNRMAWLARLIKTYEADPKEHGNVPKGEYDAAKKELAELQKQMPVEQGKVAKYMEQALALKKEKDAIDARREALKKDLYEPLTKAAGYYKQWDDALKAAELPRDADNLSGFASMFFLAASLDPADARNWVSARELYEDYLAHPAVKNLPATDEKKRGVVARLGDIYVHFAEAEKDPEARRNLVAKSVEFLQNAIATRPENNALMVAILTRDVVIMPFEDPALRRVFRIPLRRVKDAAAFRDEVKKLGTPAGTPLPAFASAADRNAYKEVIGRFQDHVAKQPEPVVKRAVETMQNAGIDWVFYREHANADIDFRVALASSYADSARPEDLPKAVWLTESLVNPPLGAVEESEEWWTAYTVRFRAYLALAEASAAPGGGTPTGTQAQWLENAAKMVKSVYGSYPDLGDATRPGTRAEWHALLQRLNGLRQKANLLPVALNLMERPKPAAAPEEPAGEEKPVSPPPGGAPVDKPAGAPR